MKHGYAIAKFRQSLTITGLFRWDGKTLWVTEFESENRYRFKPNWHLINIRDADAILDLYNVTYLPDTLIRLYRL